MMRRMTNDNTIRVHFCSILLDRTADQAYLYNYPGVNSLGKAAPAVLVK